MFLVCGLGNPGAEYEHTRHNAGFDALDIVAQRAGVRYWKTEGGALVGLGKVREQEVLFAKPQGYMNTSGGPVKSLCTKYGIKPSELIVLHDELDINPGTIRVKFGGGHAGHNGLRSICDKLQTRDWLRVRLGIGRPPGRMPVADYVLSVPKKEAWDDYMQAVQRGADATEMLILEGLEKTQQQFN